MHDYLKFTFSTSEDLVEPLNGLLSDLPFDTVIETEDGLEAYVPEPLWDEAAQEKLLFFSEIIAFQHDIEKVAQQNWNAEWESNFHPIVVEDFCGIRAPFHEPIPGVEHEILIAPKMTFGTGHHNTTWLCMKAMRQIDFKGHHVLDFGCGTGILAILALKLGASGADGNDIDDWACENSEENAVLNHVTGFNFAQGGLEVFVGRKYGVILANISKNVILGHIQALYEMALPGAQFLFSGFYESDVNDLKTAMEQAGLEFKGVEVKDNWSRIWATRPTQ